MRSTRGKGPARGAADPVRAATEPCVVREAWSLYYITDRGGAGGKPKLNGQPSMDGPVRDRRLSLPLKPLGSKHIRVEEE